MENKYISASFIKERIDQSGHRTIIGGLWEELGQLQLDFMKNSGLKPENTLLDIGCGCLRGGVKFIEYLNAKKYYGFDISPDLIDIGLKVEAADFASKISNDNFYAAEKFRYPNSWKNIEYAIAVSLFTHLSLNSIVRCLFNTHKALQPGALFYATIFLAPNDGKYSDIEQSPKIITYMDSDPYHYTYEDMTYVAKKTGFQLVAIEEFNHPRNQKMVVFKKVV